MITPVTVPGAYPQSTLKGTLTCSSHRGTGSYEPHVAGPRMCTQFYIIIVHVHSLSVSNLQTSYVKLTYSWFSLSKYCSNVVSKLLIEVGILGYSHAAFIKGLLHTILFKSKGQIFLLAITNCNKLILKMKKI